MTYPRMFVLSSDNCHMTDSHEYPSMDEILL